MSITQLSAAPGEKTAPSSTFRLTGWHVAAMLISFFGVIVVVNFSMASLASRSWTGLVVKNSYVASQGFNDRLATANAQKARGWSSTAHYDGAALSIQFADANGKALPVTDVVVEFGRPAYEQQDHRVAATRLADGFWLAQTRLHRGIWALKVTGMVEGTPYRRDARLIVGSDGRGIAR